MVSEKANLNSPANEALKDKALEYLRRYWGDIGELRQNREDALRAYRRDPYPEDSKIPAGSRSKFVMSDVADTVEAIMPSLMRIFTSGKEVVKIEGQGPEDEAGAELLNHKVNWDFTRQNNGFLVFYDWFKASMLNKFSVVKYWWDSHDEYKTEKFEGLSDEAYQELMSRSDFIEDKHEEIEVQAEIAVQDQMMGPMVLQPRIVAHNVEGRTIKRRVRRPVAEVVPPEEFICSLKTRNLKDEEFVAHRKRVHKFDLIREYDLKESELEIGEIFPTEDSELFERFKDLGGIGFFRDQEEKDFFYIFECYLKEERKDQRDPVVLTLLGDRVIRKVPNTYGHPPFCMNSPLRMPHRAIGMSVYDMVGDLQKLRTALARVMLNNIYYQTDGMMIVNPWKIDVADFVTQRRPGGIIRTKQDGVNINDAVFPVPVQPLAGHVFGLMDSVDSWIQKRTGVTSYNQGMDADSLNKTARGISEIMAAAQQRIELIARIYAETGVRDLMIAFAEMNIEFLDMPTNIRLDQRWAGVDKASIDVLFDCTVDVALGTGSREVKVNQLLGMLDRSLNQVMIASGVIQPNNVYQLLKTVYVEMGYKNVDQFVTNPEGLLPPQGVNGGLGQGQGIPGAAPAGVLQGSPALAGSPAAA